jgi:SPP1 family predicted phage head-tail adaptor
MNIGPMRNRVTIQKPVTGTNPWVSGSAGSWEDVLTTWARIQPADPKQVYSNMVESAKVSHIVTIRYPGVNFIISPGYQILFGTRIFTIQPGIINPDERNRMLNLYAWEIDGSQGGLRNGG